MELLFQVQQKDINYLLEQEIIDYYQHVNGVIVPMLNRLNICNELLRLGTTNNIDYTSKAEFIVLKRLLETFKAVNNIKITE